MTRSAVPILLNTLALLVPVGAQQTWIVDSSNGPGTHFTDLPPAVAAAAHGDTILVRSGSYQGFTTAKGLSILGSPGTNLWGWITVEGLPADRSFSIRSVPSVPPVPVLGLSGISVVNNRGAVHVDTCAFESVGVANSALATINHCHDLERLYLHGGTLQLTDCSIIQPGNFTGHGRAIHAQHGTLLISRSTIRGPDCRYSGRFYWGGNGPGLEVMNARVVIGAGSSLAAGAGWCAGNIYGGPIEGIVASATDLDLDPTVVVTGAFGALPIRSDRPVHRRMVSSAVAAAAPPGGTFRVWIQGPPNALAIVGLSTVGPIVRSRYGELALDPAPLIIGQGPIPASGTLAISLPVPNLPLGGTPIVVQAVTAEPGAFALSTPATVVLQ